MGEKTSIAWTQSTWSPTRGCSRISPGCGGAAGEGGCYAERMGGRFAGPGLPYEGFVQIGKQGARWTGKVALLDAKKVTEPLRWLKPRRIFVDSTADLFHENLTNEEIAVVFGVMQDAHWHTFQVLTKRADRMRDWFEWVSSDRAGGAAGYPGALCGHAWNDYVGNDVMARLPRGPKDPLDGTGRWVWPLPNVWLGVSVEDQQRADERIPKLLQTPAAVRFLSCEPLLESIDLTRIPANCEPNDGRVNMSDYVNALTGAGFLPPEEDIGLNRFHKIDWVIVGGESGPGARPFDPAWARKIVSQCRDAGTACFVKQMGSTIHGDDADFRTVNNWLHADGSRSFAPLIGPYVGLRPKGAVGFRLCDKKGGNMSEWPADLQVREFPEVRP